MDAAELAAIPLFTGLTPDQLETVARACEAVEIEPGSTLVREGDFGYAAYAITEGTADVLHDGALIRTLGPGDVFGEIAVFFGGQRTATVVATTPMRIVMLFNGELRRLDHDVPQLADELRKVIGERLEHDGR